MAAMATDLDQLRAGLRDLGAKPCHERRVLRAWTLGKPLDHGPRAAEAWLPLALRRALPSLAAG